MLYIKTKKDSIVFGEAIRDLGEGNIIRSLVSGQSYYMDEYDDIYTAWIDYCDKEIHKESYYLIKLDECLWTSGEVQGKWCVLGYYKDILEVE